MSQCGVLGVGPGWRATGGQKGLAGCLECEGSGRKALLPRGGVLTVVEEANVVVEGVVRVLREEASVCDAAAVGGHARNG